MLLANIVEDLHLSTEKERPLVAYFLCKHDVAESLQARKIIGSLARQLLHTVADLGAFAESCEDTRTPDDTQKVLRTLLRGFSPDFKVFLVLDGLDECDHKGGRKGVVACDSENPSEAQGPSLCFVS